MSPEELDELEEKLLDNGAKLTYDVKEAKIILGNLTAKRRIELELRSRKLWTKEIPILGDQSPGGESILPATPEKKRLRTVRPAESTQIFINASGSTTEDEMPSQGAVQTTSANIPSSPRDLSMRPTKPMIVQDSTTESEGERPPREPTGTSRKRKFSPLASITRHEDLGLGALLSAFADLVLVVKVQWLEDSIEQGAILPIEDYVVYQGQPTQKPAAETIPQLQPASIKSPPQPSASLPARPSPGQSILERAKADITANHDQSGSSNFLPAPHGERRFRDQGRRYKDHGVGKHSRGEKQLLPEMTSEFEGTDSDIPPAPEWVKQGVKYACQRVALAHPVNEDFTNELEKIKLARILTNDEIGVRAYSTSIAALRSYEYKIVSPRQILQLPGCDVRIANLWIEWKNTGHIAAAEEAQNDPALAILRDFYNIWGVGAHTAREFYYDRGWTDRDDVVEYGWQTLSRVQQIGVKYYDEFAEGIPRAEVEAIAATVREHAVRVRDEGIELLVVGGHRRGKEFSGDVDMIVSHRRLDATANLVTDIVRSLEDDGWVTHTLLLALTTTERRQATLPFRAATSTSVAGAGFDTLDKALVVWQDPSWPTHDADLAEDETAKNPAPHRRVDIIVSPWRTVGCAVYGWSAGTTFQRDTRRYAKNVKGWKFDSSGIRSRQTGEVIRLEGEEGVSGSMVDAEKTVFAGLGLEYREPWERCTG